jgi:hypothetical protein
MFMHVFREMPLGFRMAFYHRHPVAPVLFIPSSFHVYSVSMPILITSVFFQCDPAINHAA